MFCPNCSSNNSTGQKFCRKCGMNLESTSQSLLEQFPGSAQSSLSQRERRLERFGQFAFGGFGLVLLIAVIGIIYTIVTKMILAGTQPWAGALLVLFIVFAVLTLTYVVFKEDLKDRKKTINTAIDPNRVETRDTDKLLESPVFEPVPSVIEDTTELLAVEKKTRKS